MSGWRTCPLGDVLTLQRGFDITKAEQREGTIPVVSSSGINSYHDEAKVAAPGIVIGRKGSLGTCFYLKTSFWPHDTTLWVKDFKGNNPKFCFFLLQGMALAQHDVGAANPTLNRNHVHLIPVRVPDIVEQERIADILSAYDDLIEVNRRRIAALEEIARGLFTEWFTCLRFPGHEDVAIEDTANGQLPAGWRIGPFTEVADVLSGGTPKKDRPEYWGGEIPFFTPRDASESAWALDTLANVTSEGVANCNSKLYPKDTVFITARGTVGKVALAGGPMAMNQSCYALVGRGYPQFFVFSYTQFAAAHLRAMSNGAVFDTIIVDTFRKLQLPIPPAALAEKYSNTVVPIFEMSRVIAEATKRLAAARDLLLPRLISGQLSVTQAERELEVA